jgi:phosphate transport system permease protein
VTHARWRQLKDRLMTGALAATAAIAVLPLLLVLYYVAVQGLSALNWAFFTQGPKSVGEAGGGMANAIAGSLELLVLAALIGLPVGVLGGIYLAEFGRGRFGDSVRFAADVLSGVPSIVLGLVAYTLVVVPMQRFSALAGGVALALIMVPIVLRTTEEMIRLVPDPIREASLALGAPRWRTSLWVVVPAARAGIITGMMLAVARVGGETAPLLFTAFGNRYWSLLIDQPVASLPVQIFNYAISPYEIWRRQAWAGALVLVAMILVFSVLARWATRTRYPMGGSY